jgi:hypothetical protein
MSKTWSMQKQLKIGQAAEKLMMTKYPVTLSLVTGHRNWDLESSCGLRVELKTDSYPMAKTENFFMERWSVQEKDKPGGPWQAMEKGANTFLYYFSSDDTYFECRDIPALVEALNGLTNKLKPVIVKNVAWTTVGYKVPRHLLEEHFEEYGW